MSPAGISGAEAVLTVGAVAALVALRWPLWLAWRKWRERSGGEPGEAQGVPAFPAAGMVLGVSALAGAAILSAVVWSAQQPTALDTAVAEAVDPYRFALLIAFFGWLTLLANTEALIAIAAAATLVLWMRGLPGAIIPVWVAFLGGKLTTWALKFVIDRPRPEFLFDVVAHTPSFPSGHASGAISLFGILAYVAACRQAGPRQRFEIAYWAAVLIAAIAFSRLYVGVHFATDVLAGLLVGAVWLLAAIALVGSGPWDGLPKLADQGMSRLRERR